MNTNAETLMILGSGLMQKSAYMQAKELGLNIVGVDPGDKACCKKIADIYYDYDLGDISKLKDVVNKHSVTGVMTLAADYPISSIGQLNDEYGFSGISYEVAKIVTNKSKMREVVKKFNVKCPKWTLVANINNLCDFDFDINKTSPIIVKPVDSSGGRGVTFLNKGSEVFLMEEAIRYANNFSKAGQVIVEEFVSGSEFSAETVTFQGVTQIISITEKITSQEPYFMEIGHNVPYQFDEIENKVVEFFIEKVIQATGINNSPAHIEFKMRDGEPVLIEVGARLGGGFITTDLVPLATGYNMVSAAIMLSLGRKPELQKTLHRAASIRFFIPSPGCIKSIKGFSDVKNINGVSSIFCDYKIGEIIPVIRDASGRKAYIIGVAESLEDVKFLLDTAASSILIET
ncbi:hypothetical protein GCM10007160_37590 [Litchfieldella qijiaojingensis]|uniref:ATP-grasp domain-containing protein n=1 Tax=Litchfieldella qijiaojingensis TaxID=980347 RepID=A0ABQ2Z876_9GAMM|nr:ATP-grasp domain-containing protein [Halomonas qijiaojingensis]GGY06515.1 hypothetical protein GCM10007160_37590 [Halomonas qijiaojingensis]